MTHHHEEAPNKYEQAFAKFHTNLPDEDVHLAVTQLIHDNRDKYDNEETLKYLLSTVELTTLTVTDSDESVLAMVERVNRFYEEHEELPALATICVYPRFAKIVSDSLEVEGTRVACVSGGFPASQTFMEIKVAETAMALKDGADEIDMVLSVGAFQSGDYETCADEIAELKAVCGDKPLKVILETGALKKAEDIMKASIISMYAGADFIKTSTGKIDVAATPEAVYVMCRAIKEYQAETKEWCGLKVAGGIKTPDEAVDFYTIIREMLGQEFIDNGGLRIGTSSLANKLVAKILDEEGKKYF